MINAVNRYPQPHVQLLPICDALALLLQRPLCFSFFHKLKATSSYQCLRTTLCDPDLNDGFKQVVNRIKADGRKLIKIPGTDVFLGVHQIEPYQTGGQLNADFPELKPAQLASFKNLFHALEKERSGLGKDVLHGLGELHNSKQPMLMSATPVADNAYWSRRRKVLGRLTPANRDKLLRTIKPIVNGAVGLVSGSPLVEKLQNKQLPFQNLFCVLRSATNQEPRNLHFHYTAQLSLSDSQTEKIAAIFGSHAPSLMELPLGVNSRSIADSVFCSGVADFSHEETGQGRDIPSTDTYSDDWKRQQIEAKVYASIADKRHIFYVPIHVNGVAWLALFSISPRGNKIGSWAHHYALYRALISGIAESIRASAQSTYLGLIKELFLEEHRNPDTPTFIQRVNSRWEELLLVFPFPAIRLVSSTEATTAKTITLPDGRVFAVKIEEAPWFEKQIDYGAMGDAAFFRACDDAVDEAKKEARTMRLEWESQEHTIFNVLPSNQIDAALACESSELTGEARQFILDAKRKASILETSLSIPVANRPLSHLAAIKDVVGLLTWLKANGSFGKKTCVLTLPGSTSEFSLSDKPQLANAFTLFWNLWSNAAKTHGKHSSTEYWITGVRQTGSLVIAFKNAGELSPRYIHYLLQEGATWPGPAERKGLIIVKDKLKVLNWKLSAILVEGGFTTMSIALNAPNNAVQLNDGGKS
jgi:hypothetical protein